MSPSKKAVLSTEYPELVGEWDYVRNAPLTPDVITSGSGKKVWWICTRGHGFEASVAHRTHGTGCPYCSGQRVLTGFNDLRTIYPDIASQWDYQRNAELRDRYGHDMSTPDKITSNSGRKVWWKCKKGHEWQAAIYSRVGGCGCPICSGNKTLAGFNDFATINPKASKYWNYQKNGALSPDMVSPDSKKIVWWRCDIGHEWRNTVSGQNRRVNICPFCSNEAVLTGYNDLFTKHSQLMDEWDKEKNGTLDPRKLLPGSNKKVWWKCKKEHEWRAPIYDRVAGAGCPFCRGRYAIVGETDLASTNADLASEWNYEKNSTLKPEDVKEGSNKKVWWKCKKGHEWQASINSRSYHDLGCPFCSNRRIKVGFNDLATVDPALAKEWNYVKNGDLKPTDIVCGSGKKVWWVCEKGHEWKAGVVERHNGNSCPLCSIAGSSMPEQGIAFYLSQYFKIEQRSKLAGKEVDIYLPDYKIGIEYDGAYFHQDPKRDFLKDEALKNVGISLIRIKESASNHISENKCICYVADKMGKNYEWALAELFKMLYALTDNNAFTIIQVNIKQDRLKIRERFGLAQKENSLESNCPELVKQWNYDKNGLLKPDMFSTGSHEKVWWICEKGHEWQATIMNRVKGRGCPICNSRIVISGINDLATLNPALAAEWDYPQNGNIKPSNIAQNARINAWWKCPNCNGAYQSWVYNRNKGIGCPYCSVPAKKVLKGYNDLATKKPELLIEWNYDKNTSITPDSILPGSNKKVWWKCKKGHEWEASVAHRVRGRNCPYCAGRRIQVEKQ